MRGHEIALGRGPLSQKEAKNAFSWHPSAENLVCGLFERHIGTLPQKKSSQAKNLPDTEKMDNLWLSSIKLYYSEKIRNFEFNNDKNVLYHEKEHKKLHIRHLNSFFISQMVFELHVVKNPFLS